MQVFIGPAHSHATVADMPLVADFTNPPTQQDWDRVREPIRVLYLVQNHTLGQVQNVLKTRYQIKVT